MTETTIAGPGLQLSNGDQNAVAGRAEKVAGRPIITHAHGIFSSLVVLASLATGLAAAASLPLAVPFTAVAVLSLAAGASMLKTLPAGVTAQGHDRNGAADPAPFGRREIVPFLLIGVLGALGSPARTRTRVGARSWPTRSFIRVWG